MEFNCTSCLPEFTLSSSICVSNNIYNKSLFITFNEFKGIYGDFFKSGKNESTYYFFNNPEIDDPLPLFQRGLYFNGSNLLESYKVTLNFSFTLAFWYSTNLNTNILTKSSFIFNSFSIISINLTNNQEIKRFQSVNKCILLAWTFSGLILEYSHGVTSIKLICGQAFSQLVSFNGYAFYDDESEILIEPTIPVTIYRLILYPYPSNDLSLEASICNNLPYKSNCLLIIYINTYNNTKQNYLRPCEEECIYGCRTWGTCNICKNITCSECIDFSSECQENTLLNPCLKGTVLNSKKSACCSPICSDCFDKYNHTCFSCESPYKLLGTYCYQTCPIRFISNTSHCLLYVNQIILKAEFKKEYYFSEINSDMILYFNDSYDIRYNSTLSSPIPSKNRGFYFTNNSYIYTNEILLPHSLTFGFWLRQHKPGIIFQKSSYSFSTTGNFSLLNPKYSIPSIKFSNTWIQYFIRLAIISSYGRIEVSEASYENKLYYSVQDIDMVFYDTNSSLVFGSNYNGFQGFIYMIYIKFGASLLFEQSSFYACNESIIMNCTWNCSLGFYFNNHSCEPCEDKCINGCVRNTGCSLCLDKICEKCNDYTSICLECKENAFIVNGLCKCSIGYFWHDANDTCIRCRDDCLVCENSWSCLECNNGMIYDNGSCLCPSLTYKENSSCIPCDIECKECFGPSFNNCISCSSQQSLKNNRCFCPNKFFISGGQCLNCPPLCEECINSTMCLVCESEYILRNNSCDCQEGFYMQNSSCYACDPLCKTCTGALRTNCSSCHENLFQLNENTCTCINSYYLKDQSCIYCNSSQNFIILNNECQCKTGFYLNNNSCSQCHDTCLTCHNNSESSCYDCKYELVKSFNKLCLCQSGKYWDGNNCLICDSNLNLVADRFSCRCKSGYFMNISGFCVECHFTCMECSGEMDNDCLLCFENMVYNNGSCSCKSNYYFDKDLLNCVSCQENCKMCIENLGKECDICPDKCYECPNNSILVLKKCVCEIGYYSKNGNCIPCSNLCLSCYDSQFYSCLNCPYNILKSICFEICPYGYNQIDSKCEYDKKSDLIFSFKFREYNSLYETQFKDLSFGKCDINNSKSITYPQTYYQRGLFFNETSCIQLNKSKSNDLFSLEFGLLLWIRPESYDSNILLLKNENDDRLFIIQLNNSSLYIQIVIDNENYKIETSNSITFKWTSVYIILEYSNFTILSILMDNKVHSSVNISPVPYLEPKNPYYYLGNDLDSQFIFKGFIYRIELSRSDYTSRNIFIDKDILCDFSEDQSNCLLNCSNDEFLNVSNENCTKCKSECKYGCRNIDKCGMCLDDNCTKCNSFEYFSCEICEKYSILHKGKCLSCDQLNHIESCVDCSIVCNACNDSDLCKRCRADSSKIKCACSVGYKNANDSCEESNFELFLILTQDNILFFQFSENLAKDLSPKDFTLLINNETISKQINKKSSSNYQINFKVPSSSSSNQLLVNFSQTLISNTYSTLKLKPYSIKLYLNSSANLELKLQEIKNFTVTGNSVTIGITLSLSLISFDFSNFFDFLNIAELISIISLFDLEVPEEILELIRNVRVQKSIPSGFKNLIRTPKSSKVQPKFFKYGFESTSLLVNSGNTLIILTSVFLTFVINKFLFSRFTQKFAKLSFIQEYFHYNIFFKYWLQTTFELMITTTYGFNFIDVRDKWSVLDFGLCLIIFVRFI